MQSTPPLSSRGRVIDLSHEYSQSQSHVYSIDRSLEISSRSSRRRSFSSRYDLDRASSTNNEHHQYQYEESVDNNYEISQTEEWHHIEEQKAEDMVRGLLQTVERVLYEDTMGCTRHLEYLKKQKQHHLDVASSSSPAASSSFSSHPLPSASSPAAASIPQPAPSPVRFPHRKPVTSYLDECREWSSVFLHLRVEGAAIDVPMLKERNSSAMQVHQPILAAAANGHVAASSDDATVAPSANSSSPSTTAVDNISSLDSLLTITSAPRTSQINNVTAEEEEEVFASHGTISEIIAYDCSASHQKHLHHHHHKHNESRNSKRKQQRDMPPFTPERMEEWERRQQDGDDVEVDHNGRCATPDGNRTLAAASRPHTASAADDCIDASESEEIFASHGQTTQRDGKISSSQRSSRQHHPQQDDEPDFTATDDVLNLECGDDDGGAEVLFFDDSAPMPNPWNLSTSSSTSTAASIAETTKQFFADEQDDEEAEQQQRQQAAHEKEIRKSNKLIEKLHAKHQHQRPPLKTTKFEEKKKKNDTPSSPALLKRNNKLSPMDANHTKPTTATTSASVSLRDSKVRLDSARIRMTVTNTTTALVASSTASPTPSLLTARAKSCSVRRTDTSAGGGRSTAATATNNATNGVAHRIQLASATRRRAGESSSSNRASMIGVAEQLQNAITRLPRTALSRPTTSLVVSSPSVMVSSTIAAPSPSSSASSAAQARLYLSSADIRRKARHTIGTANGLSVSALVIAAPVH